MTLEFAIKEAQRRTKVLKTNHFVYAMPYGDEYIVTARELWPPYVLRVKCGNYPTKEEV